MTRQLERKMASAFAQAGVTAFRFEHRRKHKVAIFSVNGRERMIFYSHSPSDWRAEMACITLIRREIRRVRKLA